MWRKEAIPQEFKDATIIHLFKMIVLGFNDTSTLEGHFVSSPREREKRDRRESRKKGNPQVCDNHRAISLLSIAGKILARVLLNTWNGQGFYRKPVWIQEKKRNNRHDLHSRTASRKMPGTECGPLHDLFRPNKAFDAVSREGLWKSMAKFGCPAKFIAMVRQFHVGMLARVQNDGEFSDPFPVTNGFKQDCVLALTLFSMMFSARLPDAF